MATGLPYFKFTPTEWLTGDIVFEPLEVQGLFINICAIYWQRNGKLSLLDIEKRFNKPTALPSLTDRFVLVIDGFIRIAFLDEQLIERCHLSKTNSEHGKLGGRPKVLIMNNLNKNKPTAKRPLSYRQASETQEEEEEEEEELMKNLKIDSCKLAKETIGFKVIEASIDLYVGFKKNYPLNKDLDFMLRSDWIPSIRILIEKKGYTLSQIKEILNFTIEDVFWKNIIIDAKSLEKNFEKIKIIYQNQNG